mmetsp:Transcript_107819/g.303805  ORF Transcript_107819/g.303805 Transcript_107819/m.303805 type:complete len:373 (+) Transcript_107819:47-1165(+)
MGNAHVACCIARDGNEHTREKTSTRDRGESWATVPEPEEFVTFFDCVEEADDSPRRRPSTRSFTVLHRAGLGGDVMRMKSMPSVPEDSIAPDPNVEATAAKVRKMWRDRFLEGQLSAVVVDEIGSGTDGSCPELDEWTDANTVCRFLRANNGDERLAVDSLVTAIGCRVRNRDLFGSLTCEVTLDIRVIGRDLDHRPVVYFCAKSQKLPLQRVAPQLILALEAAVLLSPPSGQISMIVDMCSFSARLNADTAALRELAEVLGSVFSDRFRSIMIVDFSFLAQAVWALIKPLLTEKTQQKIAFVGESAARQIVEESFPESTRDRIMSAFDINRDTLSSDEDRERHAHLTSICDVPLRTTANSLLLENSLGQFT